LSCAVRRTALVPIRAPSGRLQNRKPRGQINASRGSSRSGIAPSSRPSGSGVPRSFMECTAKSIRPSNSASSSSLVNMALSGCPTGGRMPRSPEVVIKTVSISRPGSRICNWRTTQADCACANALCRVPILSFMRVSVRGLIRCGERPTSG